jgi:hypothetical protein
LAVVKRQNGSSELFKTVTKSWPIRFLKVIRSSMQRVFDYFGKSNDYSEANQHMLGS